MSNIDNLAAQASVIRQESEQGANTAERVGSLLEGIVSELGTTQNSLTTIYNEFINSGGSSSKITTSWIPAAATGRTTLGTLIINGTSQIIDAAVGSGSGSDVPGGGGGSGDSEIRRLIDELRSDLDNVLTRERTGIEEMVRQIIEGYNFIDGWQAGWDDELKRYLISVGVLGDDGISKGWAYLEIKYNQLKAAVDSLNALVDEDGNVINYEALEALIEAKIEESTAIAQLKARYALTNEDQTVLQWLSSGLYAEASANKALSQVFATAENYQTQQSAISNLQTKVEEIDGNYVATGTFASQVQELITGRFNTSGFMTTADLNSALAIMFATDGEKMAEITAKVQEGLSSIKFEADTIESVSQQYTIHMDKLLLGNSNFYMHTLKDNQDNNIGFEMVCAENVLQNYTEDPNGDYNKITMYYDYTAMTKLSCDHIIMSNGDQRTEQHPEYGYSDVNVECGTTFNWYDNVNANSSTGKYEFKNAAGTEGAYSGSIKFSSRGLEINMPVGKHIYLNGNIVHQTA